MTVHIPYGKHTFACELSDAAVLTSHVDQLRSPQSGLEIVRRAMAAPIDSLHLEELARGKRTCTVIVSDHTRPVPSRDILPPMLEELRRGNPEIDITLRVATGFHRGTTRDELRAKLGDRACLRAVHYWYENGLVDKRWAALNAGDIDQFLVLTRESGASSAMYLQNVVAKLGSEQPSMYALALAEHVLDGRGAVRIHGGGFGGTIQAFVPLDLVDTFIAKMNGWLGEGSARHYAISDKGAYAAWL